MDKKGTKEKNETSYKEMCKKQKRWSRQSQKDGRKENEDKTQDTRKEKEK